MQIRTTALLMIVLAIGCGIPQGGGSENNVSSIDEALSETRTMLFEGSCHWLACCAKGDCSLSNSQVTGACGTGCSDTTPWIARPNGNNNYTCGSCFQVCTGGRCALAQVWDNSSTTNGDIEGNVALFDALGLGHTENASTCSGTGQATVTIQSAVRCSTRCCAPGSWCGTSGQCCTGCAPGCPC